mmetsp:Transcript_15521/g.34272  ORF Transcript_15521/g.34272 Transcript_15521/m.34272 type:complete len:275 (-) Transcript_15521:2420-3244(-)
MVRFSALKYACSREKAYSSSRVAALRSTLPLRDVVPRISRTCFCSRFRLSERSLSAFSFSAMACRDSSYSLSVSCSFSVARISVSSLGPSSCRIVCSCIVKALRSFSSSIIFCCISPVFSSHFSDISVRTPSSAVACCSPCSSSSMRLCDQSTVERSLSTSSSLSSMEAFSLLASLLACTSPVSSLPCAFSSSFELFASSIFSLRFSSVCRWSSPTMSSSFLALMYSKYCSTTPCCFSASSSTPRWLPCTETTMLSVFLCSSARSLPDLSTYSS